MSKYPYAGKKFENSSTKIDQIQSLSFEQLRYEFLRFSPTHALALKLLKAKASNLEIKKAVCKHYEDAIEERRKRGALRKRSSKLSNSEKDLLLKDFDLVLNTAKTFGRVDIPFSKWAEDNYFDVFDGFVSRPFVFNLHAIKDSNESKEQLIDQVSWYYDSCKTQPKWPDTAVVAIPTNLPRKLILHSIAKIVDDISDPTDPKHYNYRQKLSTKYPRLTPLVTKLRLLMLKAANPEILQYELGLQADLSRTYTEISKKRKLDIDEMDYLSVLVSRALRNALLIAENAAKGAFPSTKPLLISPEPNWPKINRLNAKAWPKLKI